MLAHPGTLPEPGGLYDQPAGLLERIQVAKNVYDAVVAWRKHSLAELTDECIQLYEHVQELKRELHRDG
jgi:hypothetical protein